MPLPLSLTPSPHPPPIPSLYLHPLNDTFVPKTIALGGGQRVKIGRQTNVKTVPGERNGFFDSKVLSRQHAEVWEEGGKIYIKDVKSSNGTFINSERLSLEGVESQPFELKTDDVVEFGIDIVGDDNKTIIHHKVAARVICIISVQDALAAQRDMYTFQYHQNQQQSVQPQAAPNGAVNKRPTIQPQANALMGGMGGGARQPSRNGLTIEHILQRLSGELQKSRETTVELGAVAGAMGEIENMMGGGQPSSLPPYPQSLPPVRTQQQQQQQQQGQQSQQGPNQPHKADHDSSLALQALQNQLADTQTLLHNHVEKVRSLEILLNEQDDIKRDVNALRDLIEEQRDRHRLSSQHDDDDDDGRSVHTVVPHELESVPEEDETEVEETDEERSARREELGRPRTPEPSSLGMRDDDEDHERGMGLSQPPGIPDELTRRLNVLADQLESALEMSRNLQAQHATAQQTIESLENKVMALENKVKESQALQAAEEQRREERLSSREKEQQESMVSMFADFKKTIEERWEVVKSDWQAEHERVGKKHEEWEGRVKTLEDGVSKASIKIDNGIASITSQLTLMKTNGNIMPGNRRNGLVTPPSPRSLSGADSDSDQPMKTVLKPRKGSRSRNHRGRQNKASRSRSPATSTSATLVDGMSSTNGTESSVASVASLHSRRSSQDSPNEAQKVTPRLDLDMARLEQYPLTPEDSVRLERLKRPEMQVPQPVHNDLHKGTGLLIISLAVIAVAWRISVKE